MKFCSFIAIFATLSVMLGSTANAQTIRTVDIETTDLVYDALNQLFYAGVPSSAGFPDAATGLVDLNIDVGSAGFLGPRFAEDIEVLPGSPRSIAVSRRNRGFSPRHEGVAIFDDDVQRSSTTPGHTGANRIEFSDDSSLLFGLNNETTEFGFRNISVDADGATQTSVVRA